ncbi:sodium-dependent transporter [Pseudomonas sp. LPB0260]|uniref:sodium-dependent transporter n=1 Tax=Pseudomonas sp. LPB0260 TaxID=2614442 RepID=UPI0015C21BB1|nr:sodium-dependent transporter [Pseudomonas sp. LPB0260]QLC73710.1 sodium-dependent transporter [Pseudomonas sp. LPB0260]QLC76484.1 sodium-dependent transporter [Pseudomonas sp. LPB0260]
MANDKVSIHGAWASRWVFILAATGSAVGLGNIWKFPYMTGVYGGGAFVAMYLICIALVGVPIMLAETLIGRRGRQSPVNAMKNLAIEAGKSRGWSLAAVMGMIAALLILSFYSVVAGWSLDYILGMAGGDFVGISGEGAGAAFGGLTSDPWRLTLWHTLFMFLTALVIARGVVAGLERSLRIMMPLLFVLLLVLLGYSLTTGHFMQGFDFLFHFDPSKVREGILAAMGHAFFTLSVGVGSIMVYGAYMPKNSSIGATVIAVGLLDTLVALTAGLALFPIVFAAGLEPGAGPGLMFVTLPIAFGNIAFGQLMGLVFFVLVAVAAWSSSISMLEPAVAYFVERSGRSRTTVTALLALLCWVIGMGTVLSFNVGAEAKFFVFAEDGFHLFQWGAEGGKTFFDSIDYLTSRILLPLGGLAFALFAGWVLSREAVREELAIKSPLLFNLAYWLIRVVAPVGVLVVFVAELSK